MKKIWLSYIINKNTPLYGGRSENFNIYKTSSMDNGDLANDTRIETTVHIGTHIDMPYHFHNNGQTIDDYDIDFWFFNKPLFIEIRPKNFIIKDEVIELLENQKTKDYDILIVKTGICNFRSEDKFWEKNYGFSPALYDYLRTNFPSIRIMGFDSISISSWQDRDLGKVAHKAFLNPEKPILILEDMDLSNIRVDTNLKEILISPLRIDNCDGLPCTVFGVIDE
ncbi:cyclase family protein [Sulfurimonas sp. CS5]|uniref:cyclase family protein n=1 Tax=Sulfurimonas sp. CS5 TaxID=3391145 RepID=UPI0039ED3FB2